MKDFTHLQLLSGQLLSALSRVPKWLADKICANANKVATQLRSFPKPFIAALSKRMASDHQDSKTASVSNSENPVCHRNLKLLEISAYLREPILNTSRALTKNANFLQQVERFRNHKQSEAAITRHVDSFQLPQKNQFQVLQKEDPRSRIIASFHFGDFVYGVHKLMCLQEVTGNTQVLSEKQSTSAYLANMALGFGDKAATQGNQLLRNEISIREIASFLRLPKSTLVMFADLPGNYGSTVEIDFLSRKAHFPKSIGLLALACRVPVLPVICLKTEQGHQIELGRQIEPTVFNNENREQAIVRITQQQIHFFEYFFKQHYEQWRYLQHLPDYFAKGNC